MEGWWIAAPYLVATVFGAILIAFACGYREKQTFEQKTEKHKTRDVHITGEINGEYLIAGEAMDAASRYSDEYGEALYGLAEVVTTAKNSRGIKVIDVAAIDRAASLLDRNADVCGDFL